MGSVNFPVDFTPRTVLASTDVVLGSSADGSQRFAFNASAFRTFDNSVTIDQEAVAVDTPGLLLRHIWNDGLVPGDGGRPNFTGLRIETTVNNVNGINSGDAISAAIQSDTLGLYTYFKVNVPTMGVFPAGTDNVSLLLGRPASHNAKNYGGLTYDGSGTSLTMGYSPSNGRVMPVLNARFEDYNSDTGYGSSVNIWESIGTNRLQVQNLLGTIVHRDGTSRYEWESDNGSRIGFTGYYNADGKLFEHINSGQPFAVTPLAATTVDTAVDTQLWSSLSGATYTNRAKIDGLGGAYFKSLTIGASIGAHLDINNSAVAGPAPVTNGDVTLERSGSGQLRQVGGVQAQSFFVYNTIAGSNSEYAQLGWSGNTLFIGTAKTGTGVARPLSLMSDGTGRWSVDTSGHFMAAVDNTYDIGAAAATRPRNLYLAGSGTMAGLTIGTSGLSLAAAASLNWTGRSRLSSPADGNILLGNNAASSFSLLQFGGTTNAFPAAKRNGAALDIRLGDDSGYANLNAGIIIGTSLQSSGGVQAAAGSPLIWSGRTRLSAPVDGNLLLQNSGSTSFGLLQLGGTTNAFGAIKRNGAGAQIRLADDSAWGKLEAGDFAAHGNSGARLRSAGHLANLSEPVARKASCVIGHNDLYTVPANRKAIVTGFIYMNNQAGAVAANIYPEVKIGGTYYQIGQSVAVGAGTVGLPYGSTPPVCAPILLNAGETFSTNSDAALVSIVGVEIVEFDADVPIYRAALFGLAAGNNTLLTVPAGKTVTLGYTGFGTGNPSAALVATALFALNTSGATRTYAVSFVPSGGTPDTTNTTRTGTALADKTGLGLTNFGSQGAGDTIIVNSDSSAAGQLWHAIYTTNG